MTLSELKEKIESKHLNLSDLSVEEILKFKESGFLITALSDYFQISRDEVNKIRKKKGLNDYDFEDTLRDIFVFVDEILKEKPFFKPYIDFFCYAMILGLGSARGKEDLYIKKYSQIDWQNLNMKEEIKNKKIDVEYRKQKGIFKEILEIIEKNESKCNMILEELAPRYKSNEESTKISRKGKQEYKCYRNARNPQKSENALIFANYCCEFNCSHPTFFRKKDGKPYMEAHHLIPLGFQEYFEYSLDVEANIISLCSQCHKEIHYGENQRKLIQKFYLERKKALKACGIEIELKELYQLYDKELDCVEN